MAQIEKTRFPDSTAVKAIAYSARDRVLDVTFVSGHLYRYFDVPAEVYDRFRDAESAGISCMRKFSTDTISSA